MNAFYRDIAELSAARIPVVLATIIDQDGSAPRGAGARMLVLPDGTIRGSVGGGRYEAETITSALALHARGSEGSREDLPGLLLPFSLRGVKDMDMICGGKISILLEFLPGDAEVDAVFAVADAALERGGSFTFVTVFSIERDVKEPSAPDMPVSVRVRRFRATDALPEEVSRRAKSLAEGESAKFSLQGKEYFLERVAAPSRLHIFGAGHVGRELALLAERLGFDVTALDDRPEFADPGRFPGCRAVVLPDLGREQAGHWLTRKSLGTRDAIVIVTRGHAHDRDVLAASLRAGAGYVGMIGSKSKREGVYASLLQDGFSREDLDRVHSPVGLAIGAQTPAEIAVSIAAELIQWMRGNRGR